MATPLARTRGLSRIILTTALLAACSASHPVRDAAGDAPEGGSDRPGDAPSEGDIASEAPDARGDEDAAPQGDAQDGAATDDAAADGPVDASDAGPLCVGGLCVACDADTDCPAAKPICDRARHACAPCTSDAQCVLKLGADPGVCAEDGHCATSLETIYAKGGATCPGLGTATAPFCNARDAMAAIQVTQRLVVLRGVLDFFEVKSIGVGLPITIVGQSATILPSGTNNGIYSYAPDLLIRDLAVIGGKGAGVVVDGGGAILRVRRCRVEYNAGPGILTKGSGFDIQNTVIAHNGGTTFPGVDLSGTSSPTKVFRNNTVVANAIGVRCALAYDLVGSLISGNNLAPQVSAPCSATDACGTTCNGLDPKLDETSGQYKLTSGSPPGCIDVLDSAPATDRKGTPRPQGPKSDCGADEYTP